MALIKPNLKSKKVQTRIGLSESLLADINVYCQWANIEKVDDFIEQAVEFVFAKDKDWVEQQKR